MALLAVLRLLVGERLRRRSVAERLDADVGMRLLRRGDRGERGTDERLGLLDLAGQLVVDDDRPAVLGDRVRPVLPAMSGLSMSVTPLIRSRRLARSLAAAVTRGSPALIDPLPWTRTCSPVCSGKSAASAIMSPRLDSPLPEAESLSWFVPTLPPTMVARTTNRIHPRMADLRCCALQRPALAAMLRDGLMWTPCGGSVACMQPPGPSRRTHQGAPLYLPPEPAP